MLLYKIMITYKVKYKNYISSLYLPERKSGKVILLLPGLPPPTNIDKILNTLLSTGSVVYFPSFSGFIDSGGIFGAKNSIKDVAKLYNLATKTKIRELYFGKEIEIGKINEVILIGMSFSSVIAILGHKNKFNKIILLSSALLFKPKDFPTKELGKDFATQMNDLLSLLKNAFPFSCRTGKNSGLNDFLLGKSPLSQKKTVFEALNKLKIPTLILHGKNDTSVPVEIIESIEKKTKNSQIIWKYTDSAHSTNSYKEDSQKIITDFILS